jgi:hypothetical protein
MPPMTGPTREEFRDTMERLYDTTDQGFKALTERLDTLNGRTLKGEVGQAELRQRMVNVEKEVFPRGRRSAGVVSETAMALTKQQGFLVGVGLGAFWGVTKVVELLGTKAMHAVFEALAK